MSGISIPELCRRCQKSSPREEFVGAGYGRWCWDCYERHVRDLAEMRGMTECCDCHRKVISDSGEKTLCRLVPKDGVYQLLCEACFRKWIRLVPEQFRGTPFGRAMKL